MKWSLRIVGARSKGVPKTWLGFGVRKIWGGVKQYGPRGLFVIIGLAVLVLAGALIEENHRQVNRVVAGIGVGMVGLLLLTLEPRDLADTFRRITRLSIAGVGVEAEARSAAQTSTEEDPLEEGERADDLLDLRHLLEAKLAYLCKHVLPPEGQDDGSRLEYANFGSLKYDQYLTREEARTATRLLVFGVVGPGALGANGRSSLHAEAKAFVDGFRATVFAGFVRKRAEKAGFTVSRVYPPDDKRRDLLALRTDVTHQIVPVFATDANSLILERVKQRVARKEIQLNQGGKRIIVVPDVSEAQDSTQGDVQVCKLQSLLTGTLRPPE